jgi:hypothetical protein
MMVTAGPNTPPRAEVKRNNGFIPPLPVCTFMVCTIVNFYYNNNNEITRIKRRSKEIMSILGTGGE